MNKDNIEIVVEYSKKRIDKIAIADLFYEIMEQNLIEGVNYGTEENNCA